MTASPGESTARWGKVRELVEAALARPEHERAAFVEAESQDSALRAEVLELLRLDGTSSLEPPSLALDAFGVLDTPSDAAQDEDTPERLGPYRLLRRIGAGGMGTVHLAVRDDGEFEKRVALKLVKRGMDTEEVLRRFEQERQVLASLDHPGVARVLDGGRCPDGRPYLVMELVDGVPIDQWCDRQAASLRERIELFVQVCDAVSDAHRSLVVHRDLKPSNVLVTTDGRPKLLDFGIAKVLDARQGFATIDLTSTPLKLLTPAYASPEQVRGEPVTTASDVYSLGVVLYQLLTGRTPLRFETTTPSEIERVVCTVEPERPSAAITSMAGEETKRIERREPPTGDATRELAARRSSTPKALRRALTGDLDTVVLKALRKEPRRRYASAAELAGDLRRYLADMPVVARPDTLGYRASRFVRRNRVAVGAGALVFVSLVGGLAAALAQYARAEDARRDLAAQLTIDRERASELEVLAGDLERQRGLADAARDEAEARLAEVRVLNDELNEQRGLALERFEDVRGFATGLVFEVHRRLMRLEHADEARAYVLSLGLQFLDRLAKTSAGDAGLQRDLVGGYLRMAETQLGEPDETGAAKAAALENIERGVAIGESLTADDPAHEGNRFTLGAALLRYGEFLSAEGRRADAESAFARALAVAEGEPGSTITHPGVSYVLATALGQLGVLRVSAGAFEEAEVLFERAKRGLEELLPRRPNLRQDLAALHVERARLTAARGLHERAVDEFRAALVLIEALLADHPGHAPVQQARRDARLELAGLLPNVGGSEEASELIRGALDEFEVHRSRGDRSMGLLRFGAAAARRRAWLDAREERWADCLASTRVLVALERELRDLMPPDSPARVDLATALLREAEAALAMGEPGAATLAAEEAERHLTKALEVDAESAHALQGELVAQTILASIAERRADAEAEDAARRVHFTAALERWRAADELRKRHAPIDPWGAPDESLARKIVEGLERCETALATL